MKKLSFFIALALLSLSLNAQFSELQLSAYNNAPFDLILDGQKLASNVSQLKLGALNPGTHSIQIGYEIPVLLVCGWNFQQSTQFHELSLSW